MPNWLGDCVMAMPALKRLAEAYPHARLFLAGREQFRQFFLSQKNVAGFVPTPQSGFVHLVKSLASAQRAARDAGLPAIDAGLLFTNSLSTAAWLLRAGAKRRIGYATDCRSALLTCPIPCGEREKAWHFTQYYQWIALHAESAPPAHAAQPERATPSIRVGDAAREAAAARLREKGIREGQRYAVIAPASAYGLVKDWPPDHYRALVERVNREANLPVVVTGGAGQAGVCQAVADRQEAAVNLAGATALDEFIGLLAGSSLFVGGDSGGAHAAGALGIPSVVVFGITNPSRTRPLGGRVRYAGEGEAKDVDLSTPAAREQAKQALAAIAPESVFAAALDAMNAP